jgi:hypothetical protein
VAARGVPSDRARRKDSAARNLSAARRTTIASYAAAASLAWPRNDSGFPERDAQGHAQRGHHRVRALAFS